MTVVSGILLVSIHSRITISIAENIIGRIIFNKMLWKRWRWLVLLVCKFVSFSAWLVRNLGLKRIFIIWRTVVVQIDVWFFGLRYEICMRSFFRKEFSKTKDCVNRKNSSMIYLDLVDTKNFLNLLVMVLIWWSEEKILDQRKYFWVTFARGTFVRDCIEV